MPLFASGVAGDTFWVANGTYSSNTIQNWSFGVQPNCAIYGGFDASETLLSQRNWQSFQTVLMGGNLYAGAIVRMGENALMDGFKITHAANPIQQRNYAGAMMNINTVIANCQFINLHNSTKISVIWGYPAAASASINNCQFINNGPNNTTSPVYGGSNITCGGGPLATININDCLFKNNVAVKWNWCIYYQ